MTQYLADITVALVGVVGLVALFNLLFDIAKEISNG